MLKAFGRFSLALGFLIVFQIHAQNSCAVAQLPDALTNGSMETETNGFPAGWIFPARLLDSGYKFSLDPENPFHGNQSALVDSTMVFDQRLFGMLNQNLNPIPFQGKRVRFRAARGPCR